jgi:hypothetical protein
METREERIRAQAHRIWEEGGRPDGKDGEHWDQAAKIVDEADSVATKSSKDPTREHRDRA